MIYRWPSCFHHNYDIVYPFRKTNVRLVRAVWAIQLIQPNSLNSFFFLFFFLFFSFFVLFSELFSSVPVEQNVVRYDLIINFS